MTFQAVQNHLIDCWDIFSCVRQIPIANTHIEAICTLIRCYCCDLRQLLLYIISSSVNTLEQSTTTFPGREMIFFFSFQVFMTMTIGIGVQVLDHQSIQQVLGIRPHAQS